MTVSPALTVRLAPDTHYLAQTRDSVWKAPPLSVQSTREASGSRRGGCWSEAAQGAGFRPGPSVCASKVPLGTWPPLPPSLPSGSFLMD